MAGGREEGGEVCTGQEGNKEKEHEGRVVYEATEGIRFLNSFKQRSKSKEKSSKV